MHRDATSNKVKGEYKYISMFVSVMRGRHWVCLHTSGHAGVRLRDCLYGVVMHEENDRKQKRNLDAGRGIMRKKTG